jgi:hypothetical protein
MRFNEVKLEQPISGSWTLSSYPGRVLMNLPGRGMVYFDRSNLWAWAYPGVVAQYREAVEANALHMKVHKDGTFVIDHVDQVNPAYDPVGHALKDATGEQLVVGAVLACVAILAVAVIARA